MRRWLQDILGRWHAAVIRTVAERKALSDHDAMLSYNSRTYLKNLATLESGGIL